MPLWQDKKSGTFLSREIWPRWGQLISARASFRRSDNNQPISSSAGNFKGHRGALRDLPIWEPRHQIWNSLQSLLSDESEWRSQKYQNTMDRSKRLRKRWSTLNKRDLVRIYWHPHGFGVRGNSSKITSGSCTHYIITFGGAERPPPHVILYSFRRTPLCKILIILTYPP